MFDDNVAGVSVRIINGRLLRTGGTTSSYVMFANLTHTKFDIINVFAENTNGKCILLSGSKFDGTSSTFVGNIDGGLYASYFEWMESVKGGTYINSGTGYNKITSDIISGVTCIVTAGRNFISGTVNNSEFYSTSGKALNLITAASVASNCYAKSTTGEAGAGLQSLAINCTFISDSGYAANKLKLAQCFLTSSTTLFVTLQCSSVENCNIVSTSSGSLNGAIYISGLTNPRFTNNTIELQGTSGQAVNLVGATDASVFNNTIKVSNSVIIGIRQYGKNAFIFGNTLKGSTNMINATTGVNLWSGSIDSENNSANI
jgi:hypothetical protein